MCNEGEGPTASLRESREVVPRSECEVQPSRREALLKLTLAGATSFGWARAGGPERGGTSPRSERPSGARVSVQDSRNQEIRFGLNYVPRKSWWYVWQDWDASSIAEDFQAIADLGMDHIRIQCLWPFFQPGINYVSPAALSRLRELLDLASDSSLDVEIAVLDGWLSGYSFLPPWAAPLATDYNIFTHAKVVEAEELLFKAMIDAIGKHPRFLGFDLGNEIDVLQRTTANKATLGEADRWAATMLDYLARQAPGRFHVNGVDHWPWFADSGFSRHNLATTGSASVVHCYAYWTGALKFYRYNDVGSLHLLEYMVELAGAYQGDPARQVWVEEVGTSNEWMPDQYLPEYATVLLQNAASCGNLWGFTWWCSHDIDPSIKGFLSLEYSLGVLDSKNRPKPVGKALAKLAEEMRRTPPGRLSRSTALVIPDNGFPLPGDGGGWCVAKQFMQLIAQGIRPTIILESRAQDERYLSKRGVKDLVRVKWGE